MRRFKRNCVVLFHRTISCFLNTGLRYAQASTRYAMRAKIGNDVQQGASVEQGLLHDSKESERTPKRAYQLRRKSGESVLDRGDEFYAGARGRSSRRTWPFAEFYPVGCTPRKICCSPKNFWNRRELKPHVALSVFVGSNTTHADVCDGVTSFTAILIWTKSVVESVCCDEERAVACHFKVGHTPRRMRATRAIWLG